MTPTRKKICLLGSTGSIGRRTLDVVRDNPDLYEVTGLVANRSAEALAAQAGEFHPAAACLAGVDQSPDSQGLVNGAGRWFTGAEGVLRVLEASRPDLVVVAMVGAAGLLPTLRAIEMGATIALANKEVLVTAGEFTMDLARRRGVTILPVDSEHNAIFQCLDGRGGDSLRRIILTASGGPFRGRSRADLERVTLDEALRHPTWRMGPKITIDSATLMNKGFEAIEARHLFDVGVDRIEVLIHPQSVIHSMVEFTDGSMLAQLGLTDMYFPIAHVLSYPRRVANARFEPLDLAALGSLTFERHDPGAFPCLGYAYEAARLGGTYPAALNAANEVAVEEFLAGRIGFLDIPRIIGDVLESHQSGDAMDLGALREADSRTRVLAAEAARQTPTGAAEV